MLPTLSTERLNLRAITIEDTPAIYSYFSNDEVTKFYGMNSFKDLEDAQKLVQHFHSNFIQKKGIRWGIERKGSSELIGTIGFNLWSTAHKRAEIGYELHPDFWGKGYIKEALKCAVEYGFEELKLNRIGAIVFVENLPSKKVLERSGFVKEGLLKKYMYQNGIPHDVFIYSLIKDI